MRYTPENIERLEDNEIIVVGTNGNGAHGGGAARFAADRFGLAEGVAEGLSGKTYAFPTLNKDYTKRTLPQIRDSVLNLYECAEGNKEKTFLVTLVGTGIAGFSKEEMRGCFVDYDKPENVILPKEFSEKII